MPFSSAFLQTDFLSVVDLGVRKRPKLIYNCAVAPALCRNARNWFNSVGNNGDTAIFHFDRGHNIGRGAKNNPRKKERRDQSCPDNWTTGRTADGEPRCPEDDQPRFVSQEHGLNNWQKVVMFEEYLPPDVPRDLQTLSVSPNVMGAFDLGDDNEKLWYKTGYGLTCDEFPAARSVSLFQDYVFYSLGITAGSKEAKAMVILVQGLLHATVSSIYCSGDYDSHMYRRACAKGLCCQTRLFD